MYPDCIVNCLHFGHGLLIFLILTVFWLSETSQICSFGAFSSKCTTAHPLSQTRLPYFPTRHQSSPFFDIYIWWDIDFHIDDGLLIYMNVIESYIYIHILNCQNTPISIYLSHLLFQAPRLQKWIKPSTPMKSFIFKTTIIMTILLSAMRAFLWINTSRYISWDVINDNNVHTISDNSDPFWYNYKQLIQVMV